MLLDDRGTITIGKGASVSDYANVYSHHCGRTGGSQERAPGATRRTAYARVAYHATVLSGTKVGDWAMVGTFGLVTKDLDDYNVAIGMPAHAKRLKPDAPDAVAARHPELKR